MSPEINAVLRHLLTAFGGILIEQGLVNTDQLNALIGALLIMITLALSLWQKQHQKDHVAQAYVAGQNDAVQAMTEPVANAQQRPVQ